MSATKYEVVTGINQEDLADKVTAKMPDMQPFGSIGFDKARNFFLQPMTDEGAVGNVTNGQTIEGVEVNGVADDVTVTVADDAVTAIDLATLAVAAHEQVLSGIDVNGLTDDVELTVAGNAITGITLAESVVIQDATEITGVTVSGSGTKATFTVVNGEITAIALEVE